MLKGMYICDIQYKLKGCKSHLWIDYGFLTLSMKHGKHLGFIIDFCKSFKIQGVYA
jgi:hypothetical protein